MNFSSRQPAKTSSFTDKPGTKGRRSSHRQLRRSHPSTKAAQLTGSSLPDSKAPFKLRSKEEQTEAVLHRLPNCSTTTVTLHNFLIIPSSCFSYKKNLKKLLNTLCVCFSKFTCISCEVSIMFRKLCFKTHYIPKFHQSRPSLLI